MKRIPLAALLALAAFSFARADDGAYKNLVGMAKAAETDRGPDADDAPERVPAGRAPAGRASTEADELKDAVADVPEPRPAPASRPDAAPVPPGVPAAPRPRLWTRLYSTLLPSWRRPPSFQTAFDPRVSTDTIRTTPDAALDSEAVAAGERRGLSELMSVPAPATAQ